MSFILAVWTRLELATFRVTGGYSNQLNYQTIEREAGLKPATLSLEG